MLRQSVPLSCSGNQVDTVLVSRKQMKSLDLSVILPRMRSLLCIIFLRISNSGKGRESIIVRSS